MALPSRSLRTAPATKTTSAPALKVLRPPRAQKARVPFFAICLLVLMGAMLGALVLNTTMASAAYEMHSTQIELGRTLQHNAEKAAEVDRLSSPSRLAEKATSLGMVPGEGVTYIDLESAALLTQVGKTAKD